MPETEQTELDPTRPFAFDGQPILTGQENSDRNRNHAGLTNTEYIDIRRPFSEPDRGLQRTTWQQIADAGDQDFLIDGIIPTGQSTLLYAPPGVGKSLIALHMALAIAEGTQILGHFRAKQGKVMYLDYELGYATMKTRLAAFGYQPEHLSWLDDKLWLYQQPDVLINEPNNIIDEADLVQPDLIIIDSLGLALGGDENSPEAMKDYGRTLGNYCKHKNIAVLLIDNTGKDHRLGARGTSRKIDEAELEWKLKSTGERYVLQRGKDRFGQSPAAISFEKVTKPNLTFEVTMSTTLSTQAQYIVDGWKKTGFQPTSTQHARNEGTEGREEHIQEAVNHMKTFGWWTND